MAREADFSQLEEFLRNWSSVYDDFDDFLRRFLLEQGQRAIAEIKKRQSGHYGDEYKAVDTGAMLNSWFIEDVVVSGTDLHVTIGNSMNYALT